MVNANVDLTAKVVDLPPYPLSSTVSTYGKPITTDTALRTNYTKIAKGSLIRIPLQWNNGSPCTSVSSAVQAHASASASRSAPMAALDSTTPLCGPVVPLV